MIAQVPPNLVRFLAMSSRTLPEHLTSGPKRRPKPVELRISVFEMRNDRKWMVLQSIHSRHLMFAVLRGMHHAKTDRDGIPVGLVEIGRIGENA
jgi:hypothetical protein